MRLVSAVMEAAVSPVTVKDRDAPRGTAAPKSKSSQIHILYRIAS